MEPRAAAAAAAAALKGGWLRINHYKLGKRLKNAKRDASLVPLGRALRAEIGRAYGGQAAVVARKQVPA